MDQTHQILSIDWKAAATLVVATVALVVGITSLVHQSYWKKKEFDENEKIFLREKLESFYENLAKQKSKTLSSALKTQLKHIEHKNLKKPLPPLEITCLDTTLLRNCGLISQLYFPELLEKTKNVRKQAARLDRSILENRHNIEWLSKLSDSEPCESFEQACNECLESVVEISKSLT